MLHKSKRKSQAARAAHAKTYQEGFDHGYRMGLEQGRKEAAHIRTVVGTNFTLTESEIDHIVQGVGRLGGAI